MNIAIIGYGKMGKEIETLAIQRGHKIRLIIDKHNLLELNDNNLKEIDVAIEFTTPETAYDNYLKCFAANVPVVSGSTGWLDRFNELKKYCINNKKTFFYASNFSLGVNILFEINKQLARIMNQFDNYNIEIEEIHHTEKLDAPSGTAINLANDIINNIDRKEKWTKEKETIESDLAIKSLRKFKIPGIHTIKYESDVDTLLINHSAKSRKGFVLGAVLSAEYVNGKNGFFGMNDLLNF